AMLPAHAACNNVMTYQFDPSTGVVLSPSTLTVPNGACVTLHNATITSAQFTVGAHYKGTAPAFSDATPGYVAGPAGTSQAVTATGAAGTAHGTIVVKAAPAKPSPSPSPSSHSSTPSPRQTSSPPRQPSPTPTATRPAPLTTTPTASPAPAQPLVSPPPGSTPFLAGQPTPTPSTSSAPTVITGPLQPPTDRGTGLPAALAALAVVGTAGALLRVLLAEPIGSVDSGRTVGATS
ncbi:MAG TPA: hypothetical protein VKJ07_10915, partial [Mycobacteriales bacterium]|nr:hypothetical protein [Mycobacteriales bacterium]